MTSPSPQSCTLADLLEQRRETIIERWTERMRAGNLVDDRLSTPTLRNSLPEFLDQVAAALRRQPQAAPCGEVAREHGRQRYRVGFDLRTVVIEYDMLREVLFDTIEESGRPLQIAEIRALCAVFAGGIAEAVDQFSRDRDSDMQAGAAERERASEFERQLIAIVSHDLRSPLAAILIAAEAVARRGAPDDKTARLLLRIQTGAHRATRLINDLLDYSHERKSGRIPVRPQDVSLRLLVREAIDEAATMFPERIIEYACEDPILARVDPDRIAQVLSNLLTNALKYSPTSTVVRVTTRVSAEAEAVTIEVHNWGPPIPPERRGSLFEPFQGDPSLRARASLGLGLHISRQIVLAHGGTIDVCSNAEDGTTFTCTLPRQPHAVPIPVTA
ncbi:HAMP domain-containing sensor histidine kinase [Nannocystis sp. ILAH1]|uniref:sensor histidine kinase n=1 Tax=unclassified Nannocystis TaxID=2627009 RepID=UPI00226DE825|nr:MULTISPECIES: HAMP domain-containing sensor histidine kinase [unclassified Nannocystis]MCY0992929.1 HAMP domain-containing sensor histidine kinase [Nannocystis sp. ILAH1]MCY1066238.1 HAMP domain-containing sensor histidine kinase [Nannocystis sp. RBIL2]